MAAGTAATVYEYNDDVIAKFESSAKRALSEEEKQGVMICVTKAVVKRLYPTLSEDPRCAR